MRNDERLINSNNTEIKVMSFGDLRQADSISIKTERSNYQFSVLNTNSRIGMLAGGVLGDLARESMLIAAVSEDDALYNTVELRTGWRALFYVVEENNRLTRMITSVVTDIVHIRGILDERPAA